MKDDLLAYNAKDVLMTQSLADLYPDHCVDPPEEPLFFGYWREWPEPDEDRLQEEPPPGLSGKMLAVWHHLHDEFLWPGNLVDPSWDAVERAAVVEHLKAGKICHMWLGYAWCRLCGCNLGTCCMTDGTWQWPQKVEHYLTEHLVKPPAEFVEHVLAQKGR